MFSFFLSSFAVFKMWVFFFFFRKPLGVEKKMLSSLMIIKIDWSILIQQIVVQMMLHPRLTVTGCFLLLCWDEIWSLPFIKR